MRLFKRLRQPGAKKGTFKQPNFWSNPSFLSTGLSGDREWIENDFSAYVQQI